MNIIKTSLTAALALSAATLAHADATLHITGSTAFRGATMTAIQNILTGVKAAYYNGDGSSSLNGANLAIIQGTHATFGVVTVKCIWTGSGAGIQVVDQDIPLSTWMANANLPGSGTAAVASPSYDSAVTADVAMADNLQISTPFTSKVLVEPNDQPVGVIVFEWVSNVGTSAVFGSNTNATKQLTQALLTGGMPLSMWTGNSADTNKGVYAIGRNADSGTRIITFAESGFGITTRPTQWYPTNFDGSGNIAQFDKYPAETVLGTPYSAGQSGYDSGGKVATQMKKACVAGGATGALAHFGPGYFMSYLGRNDANGVVTAGGLRFTWEGFVDTDTNVKEGRYTFWSYERMYYRDTLAGTELSLAGAIADRIYNFDAPASGLKVTDLNVNRSGDGDLVVHN